MAWKAVSVLPAPPLFMDLHRGRSSEATDAFWEKKASLAPPAPLYHSYLHGDGRPRQDQGKVTTSCWKLLPKGVYRTDYAGVPRRLNRRGCCKGNLIFLLGLISLHAWPSFILLRSHYSTIQDMRLSTVLSI